MSWDAEAKLPIVGCLNFLLSAEEPVAAEMFGPGDGFIMLSSYTSELISYGVFNESTTRNI